jgi:hypothetical protein
VSDYKPDILGKVGYSPSTGKFVWLRGKRRGQEMGFVNEAGYAMLRYGGKQTPAHHLAWRIMTGRWPTTEIDHINRVKHDNRFENLREATRHENSRNKARHSNNTSGYKGVHWHKGTRSWVARIMVDGQAIHLGCFADPKEAHAAYAEAAKHLHGVFHCID